MFGLNRTKLPDNIKRPYYAFFNQKSRCGNPSNGRYKTYGGKGIKVEYSLEELIDWYINESNGESFLDPTIGRINHNKNYSLDNIQIQERIENSQERQKRCGPSIPNKPIKIKNLITGQEMIANCCSNASELTGIPKTTIRNQCYGLYRKNKQNYKFRFVGVQS
jgi:hypothetical protein